MSRLAASDRDWRGQGVALAALLRRDLLGGSRGAAVLWARGLAVLASAGAAILAFATTTAEIRNDVAAGAALVLFSALLLIGFLLAVPIAVSSLRREREAGMLDLLLLAGIRPATLAAGRALSSWLFLQSLLLAALPGLGLLWFYRQPSPSALALCAVALSLHFFALAAVAVAISAWSRHAGYAIALCIVVMGAWMGVLIAAPDLGWPLTSTLVAHATLGPSNLMNAPAMTAGDHVAGWLLDAIAGTAAIAVAVRGLGRTTGRVQRDTLRERIDRKRRPLRATWALTWLLQRRSAPARPAIQAVVVLPLVAYALVAGDDVAAVTGGLLALAGLIVTATLAATAIAPERERRTWESVVATGRPGRLIVADLLCGILAGSAVPVLSGLLLCAASLTAAGGMPPANLLVAGVSLVVTWILLAVAALAGSAAASRTAGALSIAGGLLFAMPALAMGGAAAMEAAIASPLDAGGVAAWLMLVAAAAFGAAWLALRAGWRSRPKLALALAPTLALCALPVVIGEVGEIAYVGPFVGLGAFGIVLLVSGLRRTQLLRVLVGLLLLGSCILVPLSTAGLGDDDRLVAAAGGFAFPWLPLEFVADGDLPSLAALAVGAALHATILWALLAAFLPRIERWLGRAA